MTKMWKVEAQRMVEYEIVVEADTEGRARAMAREAIEDGPHRHDLVEFVVDDTGLDMWSREIQ